ncbi:NUDIX hydrolase [Nonomuraea sp. NPDC000554]|uniref:NUDIX hydrolase n=1 Tax=Nonomuraea sp. NPDC000554 TaxID=3154259 RepID=UPI003330A759
MLWKVHSEKPLYTDPWLDVRLADVELFDGRRLQHRVIRTAPKAGAVVTDIRDRVLLIWRHRFITDSWGWEIPLCAIDEGEDFAAAAGRGFESASGWRPGPLRPLLCVQPSNGTSDSVHHVYRADTASYVSAAPRPADAERVDWIPVQSLPGLIDLGDVVDGTTLASLLYLLAEQPLPERRGRLAVRPPWM